MQDGLPFKVRKKVLMSTEGLWEAGRRRRAREPRGAAGMGNFGLLIDSPLCSSESRAGRLQDNLHGPLHGGGHELHALSTRHRRRLETLFHAYFFMSRPRV